MAEHSGILLLGPTGSGKSPLGDRIEASGLGDRQFAHFDFGANLRRVVAEEQAGERFSAEELTFLRDVLQSGALLENEHFPLAERILSRFVEQRCSQGRLEVVLNGLPRHAGQAEAVGRLIRVHTVVSLECGEEVVAARIGSNIGGDRSDRSDDGCDAVRRKLAIFAERTGPLVEYYRALGRRVIVLPVTVAMTPETAWLELQAQVAESNG